MTDHTASYPFPVLGLDRLDYIDSCCYNTSDWSIMSGEVRIRHKVEGHSLVSEMLKQGNAQFGCVVVLRATMYREIFCCGAKNTVALQQILPLDERYRSNEVPKFMPAVVYLGDDISIKAAEEHGVDELWFGHVFKLCKGAILARGVWHWVIPGSGHLLRVKKDDGMADGVIQVELGLSGAGHFSINVSPNFYKSINQMKSLGKDKQYHVNSILTHALSGGLEKLAEYNGCNDIDLDVCENFMVLKQALETKGEPTWDDDDFDACRAASVYWPHCLEFNSSNDDDDDNY